MEPVTEIRVISGIVTGITRNTDRTILKICEKQNGQAEEYKINFFNLPGRPFAEWFDHTGITENKVAAAQCICKGNWIKGTLATKGGLFPDKGKQILTGTICTEPRQSHCQFNVSIPVRVKTGDRYEDLWAFIALNNCFSVHKGQGVSAVLENCTLIRLKDGSTALKGTSNIYEIY